MHSEGSLNTEPILQVQSNTTVIDSQRRLINLDIKELWAYRELIVFLTWREIRVAYAQTKLGILWAVIQPVMSVVVFTVVFGVIAGIESEGPYPLFAFAAMLPWNYLSTVVNGVSGSLVSNKGLITKIYFPRLIIPLVSLLKPLFDAGLTFLVLLLMMAFYKVAITLKVIALLGFLLLGGLVGLAVGVWLGAMNVRYRDVRHFTNYFVRFWMYASPIIYPLSSVPERWRTLYSLNPMVTVIQGARWALLGQDMVDLQISLISFGAVLVVLVGGLIYFSRVEDIFADVI